MEWQTITIRLGDLRPWGRNPRQINERQAERLLASWEEFGQVETVAIGPDNEVYNGHQRLDVLKAAYGLEYEIEARQSSRPLTEEERERLSILLHAGAMGNWDWDILANWDSNLLLDSGLDGALRDILKADIKALDGLLQDKKEYPDSSPQIDRAAELQEKWGVKRGDVWEVPSLEMPGKSHRLMCGDSGNADDVARLMDGQKAILMDTDPPYGVDFEGGKYNPKAKTWDGIEGDHRQGDDLTDWLADCLSIWLNYMEPYSAFYIWSVLVDGSVLNALRRIGLHYQSQIVWNKNSLVLGQADYHWKHENCIFAVREDEMYREAQDVCWYAFWKGKKHRWFGGRTQTTVWEVDKVNPSSYLHPMQKPTELYAIPIRNHTHRGEILVDPFAGCGTSLVAAEQMGRLCFGMEISEKFCSVSLQRLTDLGLSPTRIGPTDAAT